MSGKAGRVKRRRYRRLRAEQLEIVMAYLDCGNYSQVAKQVGVSRAAVNFKVRRDALKLLSILGWNTWITGAPVAEHVDEALHHWRGPLQAGSKLVLSHLKRLEQGTQPKNG